VRIFVDSVRIGVGGGRTYSYNLLKACNEIDLAHEYDVLVLAEAFGQFSRLASDRLAVLRESQRVPASGWKRVLWEQFTLPLILRRSSADIFLSMGSTDVFAASWVAHVPSVVVIQMNQPWMVPDLMPASLKVVKWGMALSKHTASHFLSVSETTKREIVQVFGIEPHRISVVHYGGASEIFSPEASSRRGILDRYGITQPYILSVSSVFTFKNYLRLVQAYDILRTKLSTAPRLLVIGAVKHRSYFDEITELIDALGLQESVKFLGYVAHDDLPAIYANAQAYVFPSLCETFGLTPLEAMACGVPVAASNVSVMPEVCGDAAVYFDPYDPDDVADVMLEVLTDRSLREDLIARGFRRVQQFSWEKAARQTLRVLEEVAGN